MHNRLSLRFWLLAIGCAIVGFWGALTYYLLMGFQLLKTATLTFQGAVFGFFILSLLPRWFMIRSSRVANGTATASEVAWAKQWGYISIIISFVLEGAMKVLGIKPSLRGIAFLSGAIIGGVVAQVLFSLRNKEEILCESGRKLPSPPYTQKSSM